MVSPNLTDEFRLLPKHRRSYVRYRARMRQVSETDVSSTVAF